MAQTILLIGGPKNGETMVVPDLRDQYRFEVVEDFSPRSRWVEVKTICYNYHLFRVGFQDIHTYCWDELTIAELTGLVNDYITGKRQPKEFYGIQEDEQEV